LYSSVSVITSSSKASSNKTSIQSGKSIEETFQKISQCEHVLLKPEAYVGLLKAVSGKFWV
jgi:DNA topoisomerase II